MYRLITTFGWRLAGVPLLLLISVYGLYSHAMERQHRIQVLTHGSQTDARIVKSSGIESVRVAWTDSSGQPRTADAWTGKPLARLARAGQVVAIKYLPGATLGPVILSEVAERDRVNEWWIRTNAWVALAMTALCAILAVVVLAARYHPHDPSGG